MSKQCPTGCKEAEELYQLARKYRVGHGGFPRDKAKAEKLFEEALLMGNAKAALAIGQMYMYDYASRASKDKRYKYMLSMYEQAMEMGCPEGYQFMAECQSKGWGMRANTKKAMGLLKTAAEMGSPKAMEFYAVYLIEDLNQVAEGRQWLQRSMALGNGDAGLALADSYIGEENAEQIIQNTRAGAALGSKACIMSLG